MILMRTIILVCLLLTYSEGNSQNTHFSIDREGSLVISYDKSVEDRFIRFPRSFRYDYIYSQKAKNRFANGDYSQPKADSLVKKRGGILVLDAVGEYGAYCGYDNVVRIFDQNTLEFDSVRINQPESSLYIVWFRESPIWIIGNHEHIFTYDQSSKALRHLLMLENHIILDYEKDTDQFLVGRHKGTKNGEYQVVTLLKFRLQDQELTKIEEGEYWYASSTFRKNPFIAKSALSKIKLRGSY